MTGIISKRLGGGGVIQQFGIAVRPYDMAPFGILYVDLVHICGEGDYEPSLIEVGPETLAAGVFCTAYRSGYSLRRGGGRDPA